MPLLESSLNDDMDEEFYKSEPASKGPLQVFKSLSLGKRIAICAGSLIFLTVLIVSIYYIARPKTSPNSDNVSPQTNTESTSNSCDLLPEPTCSGSSKQMPSDWADHLWNTPHPGDADYRSSFQDMYVLQGYAQLRYSSDRKSCTVNIFTKTAKDLKLYYYFDGIKQEQSSKTYDSSYTGELQVVVQAETGERLQLEEIDFIWNTATTLPNRNGDYRNGQKGAIVEMFGWPDDQIEQECRVIADAGYLGVKLFPHMEQLMSWQPFENALNPWYFMYQPVSYSLNGRMGNRSTLRKMIKTCRSYGLRVYADAVVNHMTGNGNDMNYHHNPGAGCTAWPPKTSSGELYDNNVSPFYTPGYTYQTNPHTGRGTNVLEFPRVPYGPMDFHCEKSLNSWSDPNILDSGWLTGLTDLDTSSDYVRQRIADHFVDLMSIGFTGFRVDAAKHIRPDDLAVIFGKFKAAMGGSLPVDYFSWLEVLTGGEGYLLVGGDSEYSFTTYLERRLKEEGLTSSEVDQIKLWWSPYPVEPHLDNGRLNSKRKVIQNDDHDQQNPGSSSRDMHDDGCVLVKGCAPEKHRSFEVKLFTNPNGASDNDNDYPIRMILSSYYFVDGVMSPPDGLSDCSLCKITCDSCKSRSYAQAYKADAKAYEGSDYTRVHRDATIIAAMHQWMHI